VEKLGGWLWGYGFWGSVVWLVEEAAQKVWKMRRNFKWVDRFVGWRRGVGRRLPAPTGFYAFLILKPVYSSGPVLVRDRDADEDLEYWIH
jgi:hypothetical protein